MSITTKNHNLYLLLIAILLISISFLFKDYLQESMALHMLVQIPIIVLSGVCVTLSLNHSDITKTKAYKYVASKIKPYNILGISGFFYIVIVSMYWMLPKALDQVLVSDYAQISKYISLLIAGIILPWSYQASHTVVRLFFIGGICWAMAIVGLLYQEADTRLCNFYLLSDQIWAGRGLVTLAVAIPICWIYLERLQYKNSIKANHA